VTAARLGGLLALLAAAPGLAAEPGDHRGRADEAPPAARGEAGEPRRLPEAPLPAPRLSDQPFHPVAPGRSRGPRESERGCCSREH
jgi:hypothetical protein